MSAIPKIQQFLKEQLRFSSSSLVIIGQNLEDFEEYSKDNLEEWFYLEKGKELGATAIYFRRFPNRPSVPQILIYDFSNQPLHSQETLNKEIATLQNKVWSWGGVSSLYIFTDTALKIVDCSQSSNENDNPTFLEEHISLSVAIEKKIKAKYSGELFDSGLFWEKEENKNKFEFTLSAYDTLLTGLKKICDNFIEERYNESYNETLTDAEKAKVKAEIASFVHRLLIQCVLVKYLEERKDYDEKGNIIAQVFPIDYFRQFADSQNFCDVLRKGKVLDLFNFLHTEQFNGNIFQWQDKREQQLLKNIDFTSLADLLDANIENKQYVLWRLYDFEQIPIELISGIYEAFLGNNSEGVVYTPPHLVQFLIDECMPLKAVLDENHPFRKGKYKIIDPACGSGIFLVGTFKRLVQWWRIIHKGKKPKVKDLQKILSRNIFGTEFIGDAAMVSTFSLGLALCDLLSPKQIWTELRFSDLSRENILRKDFLLYIREKEIPNDFDLVIGNPPFMRGNNQEPTKENKQEGLTLLEKERETTKQIRIPQKQIALYFMEYSMNLLKENGLQCLILPSASLLYSYDVNYRDNFIERYNVLQIADFTLLARNNSLWNEADVSTAVIFTEKSSPQKDSILHIVFKRTLVNRKKKYFELDEYDFHFVSREDALLYPFVWKANLLGGIHIFLIIRHFSKQKKIKDILLEEKENGCQYGEGFILSQNKKNNQTKSLKGELFLDAKQTDTLDKNNFLKELKPYQEDLYLPVKSEKKNIYFGPHLIIKEIVHNSEPLFIVKTEKTVVFGHRFLSIYHPNKQKIENITHYLTNSESDILIRFYLYATSASALILKNTALQAEDLLAIPITEDFEPYQLNKREKIVIEDTLNYTIDFFTHLHTKMNQSILEIKQLEKIIIKFTETFCETLNNVFTENEKVFYLWKTSKTENFICIAIKYGAKPQTLFDIYKTDFQLNEDELEQLTRNQSGDNILIRRIIRIYKDNTIYLIKPNLHCYWLQSIALRDADITYADLHKAGY